MAKANPTKLGLQGNLYITGAGESCTFVRCDKCNQKYIKEKNLEGCPNKCNKVLPNKPKEEK